MDPFQYQQQQQLQYQQQYGQQPVQFVPAFPYNVQAQTNQHAAASGQYGGAFTAFPQQSMVGMYPTVVPETQFSQSQGHPQVFTSTAFAVQGLENQTYQTSFGGAYQFQQQPTTNLQSTDAVTSLPATTTSSTSFAPPPMDFPSISVASSGVQPSLNDVNQVYSEQYQKWQKQYNEWQAQHANHPDQKLFQEYQIQVQQWQQNQQQMLQAQGVGFSQQSKTPQTTPSQSGQPSTDLTHSQPIHDPSVNFSSQVSQQTGTSHQFPSMSYHSSSNFSNQGPELKKDPSVNLSAQTGTTSHQFPSMSYSSSNFSNQGPELKKDPSVNLSAQTGTSHQFPSMSYHSSSNFSNQGPELKKEPSVKLSAQTGTSQQFPSMSYPSSSNFSNKGPELKKDPSVNLSSHVSQQTGTSQQFPSMSYHSSSNFSNQGPGLNRIDQQNKTQNFPNSSRHQDRNTTQYGKISENKRLDHYRWQQSQQLQQHNQDIWPNPKTNVNSSQSQGSIGRQKSEFPIESSTHGWFKKDNKPSQPLSKWMQSQGNTSQQEVDKSSEIPKWMQSQGNTSQQEVNKSVEIPKWMQSQGNTSQQEVNKSAEIPKWMQSQGNTSQQEVNKSSHVPKWMQSQWNTSPQEVNQSANVPNWMQSQGNTSQQEVNKSTHVPKWMQSQWNTSQQEVNQSANVSKWMQSQGNTSQQKVNNSTRVSKWMQSQGNTSQQEVNTSADVPKWMQSQGNTSQPEFNKSANVPKWMQSQGNTSQQEVDKSANVKTPIWLQRVTCNKDTTMEKESTKSLPKWLKESNQGSRSIEQQGLQGEVNRQQTDRQGTATVQEHAQGKTINEAKMLPKWLQDSSKTTSVQSSPTTQAESSQAKQPFTAAALSTASSPIDIYIKKLDPKQELELLQKQSLQLLQLAQLEKMHKENQSGKPLEANQPVLQKPTKSEQKSDVSKNQATTAGDQASQLSSNKEYLTTRAPSEHPIQDVIQEESTGQHSANQKMIDDIRKPHAPTKLKSVPCKFFPNCRYGADCKFRHPPCTTGKSCTLKDCIFDHSDLPDHPPVRGFKESSFGSFNKQDVNIPGIGDDSHYVKPAVDTEESQPPLVPEAKPVESSNHMPPHQIGDEVSRYPEERAGEEPNRWCDEDVWQRWRTERDRDYLDRNERLMPPREQPLPTWEEKERLYPRNRDEWDRSERPRPWRDHWETSPERDSERDRWLPPRDEEYRRYENERWERPPTDSWDYPSFREDPRHRPLSPRYRREPEFDRERSPLRALPRERPYCDQEFRNEPPHPRRYEEIDRYSRPLSPPPPEDYDRRREWEDRGREYYRPYSREPDGRDYRDSGLADRQSDRHIEDYGHHGRGRSPPVDPSRPSIEDRPRYRDYPPDYDRRDRDRRDADRAHDSRHDVHPEWRNNPQAHHEDLGYPDQPPTREAVKPDKPKAVVVPVETILDKPGRDSRPDRIVIIMRGLPGSGKTHVARLVKDKEASNGAHAPRIISLDDYFLTEVEKQEKDPDTGKRVKKKVTEYLYEAEMEDSYRASMFKSFSKTLEDGFFPVVMVDAINNKVEYFEKYWSLAKQKGFEVYIAELSADSHVCAKRNSHSRTFEEISKIQSEWDESPTHMLRLDVRSLLQDAVITEVEMEAADDTTASDLPKDSDSSEKKNDDEEEDEEELKSGIQLPQRSKWDDMDSSAEAQLNKLDGIRPLKRRREASPPLSLSDDEDPYDEKEEDMRIGKKRVRWADIEDSKHMEHRRRIGFCIGTDWSLLTDPNAKIPEH